jgi:glycosyltransferase involved in cell wall biosynthesis/SAM-dependent methyltransferase
MRARATEPTVTTRRRPGEQERVRATPGDGKRDAGDPLPRRRMLAEGALVYLAFQLLTVLFLPALRVRDQTFYQELLVATLGPQKRGIAQLLRQGILPTWLRDQWGGEAFIANIQTGVLYPGHIPFWVLPTSLGLKVVVALHVAFAAVGMWAYCRIGLRTGRWAAVIAGLGFGFGGLTLQHIVLTNQLEVIAWMPLVLLFTHLALERGRLRYVVLSGVAVGLQFLAGHPEEWLYTLVTMALYGVFWSFGAGLRAWPQRALAGALRLGGAIVTFVLLFGWQLLPTLQLQRLGFRTDPGFNEQYPLPKAVAVNALLPDFGHVQVGENVGFIGVVGLGLAALGVAAGRRDLRWLRAGLAVLAVGGFLMALGSQSTVYRAAYESISVVRQLRVPVRWLILPYFAFAVGAALGADVLLHANLGRRWRARALQLALGAGAVLAFFGVALAAGDISEVADSLRPWIAAAVVLAAAAALATLPTVPRVAIAAVLLAAATVELQQARPRAEYRQVAPNVVYNDPGPVLELLGREGGRYVTIADLPSTPAERASIQMPADLKGSARDYYLVARPRLLIARPATEYATHAQTVLGRDGGLAPTRTYGDFFTRAVNGNAMVTAGAFVQPPSKWKWGALDFLAVRWFVTERLPPREAKVLEGHGFRVIGRYAYVLVWERSEPPLARMIYDADVVAGYEQRVARLDGGYPLLDRAMVEKPVGALGRPTTPPVVHTTRVEHASVEVSVRSDASGLLVLADPWAPAWRVTVDGKPAELLRTDHAFRGVWLPAGQHTVVFTYDDRLMQLGAWLALVTVVGLLAAWLVLRRRRAAAGETGATAGTAGRTSWPRLPSSMPTPDRSPAGGVDSPLRVSLFGTYDRIAHPRIAILEAALRRAGAEVSEVHVPAWQGGTEEKLRAATNPLRPLALLRLAGAWVRLARRFHQVGPQDVVLVGYFGHLDVHLARLLAGRRRVVLDMFLSVYDTVVLDRGSVAPGSLRARLCRLLDRRAVRASRLALLDTQAQVEFCNRVLGIPEAVLAAVPVGAEPERFPDRAPPEGGPLRVLFYGSFIPLHGTGTLAAAIRLLEDTPIELTVVGRGQERAAFDRQIAGAANVTVLDWVDYDRLGELVADHHVVVGILGTSEKASRVVPNKVYQAACAGRAIVTANTPAIREAFADGELALVPPGDPQALAATLRALAADRDRVTELGRRARARFQREHAPEPLGRHLTGILRPPEPASGGERDSAGSGRKGSSVEWAPPPRFLLRLDLVRRLLVRLDRRQPVLELGFGAGGMLQELVRQGFQDIVGTDFSPSAVRDAARRLADLPPGVRPRLLRASLEAFHPARARFGAILAFEVLEHVADDKGLLNQAYELLEPGGSMLVSVPAHRARFSSWDSAVGHVRRYERDELLERFVEAGFTVETFWCYGYPLANLLDRVRRLITSPPEPGSAVALELRTAESGNRVPARGLVKLLVRPATMAPFLLAQRLALHGDRGDGYIVLARKPGAASRPVAAQAVGMGATGPSGRA